MVQHPDQTTQRKKCPLGSVAKPPDVHTLGLKWDTGSMCGKRWMEDENRLQRD